ncbi:hypothetical protein RHECIAT_CH0000499 [Rhizobium etli CIAT 652]|uniref:DUF4145 domain-containing protein n=1 Tax=Rhizobium etli (strain CIAT 652) TaxID=491916 RepID=B3Q060_RHIE6|nr:hypothetical protein RHECIAT_CH0000499 [Rhizobium etli CIAT 652]
MAVESLIGSKLKAYCSNCRGDRNCEIKGHHQENDDGDYGFWWRRDWYLLVCCGCDHVFAQSVAIDSESYHQEYDSSGDVITVPDETVRSWPARSKRDRPEWFQHSSIETKAAVGDLSASLVELYGALDHDLNVLAAIGIRTSFDIAAEILGVDPSKNFQRKLDEMVSKNLIRQSEREHLDVLINAGNASAHRGWTPSFSDLSTLMDTLESFLNDVFIVPAKKEAAAAKMAKIKAKVPVKKAKSKAPGTDPKGNGPAKPQP